VTDAEDCSPMEKRELLTILAKIRQDNKICETERKNADQKLDTEIATTSAFMTESRNWRGIIRDDASAHKTEILLALAALDAKITNQRSFMGGAIFAVSGFWIVGFAVFEFFRRGSSS